MKNKNEVIYTANGTETICSVMHEYDDEIEILDDEKFENIKELKNINDGIYTRRPSTEMAIKAINQLIRNQKKIIDYINNMEE